MMTRQANFPPGHGARPGLPGELVGIPDGPILASQIGACGIGRAIGLRAGQNIVLVWLITARIDPIALLVERSLFIEVVIVRMQVSDVIGNLDPLALYQGPLPIRSRAFTGGLPSAALTLR
jgi:hypothetical protein